MDPKAEDSLPVTQTKGTLGTLFLVGRKTGLNVQGFPIDSERVTIGRDYDCDIRLYFSDVSKLHAEIVFDLLSGQAHLRVHGGNGVHYTALDQQPVVLKPPAAVVLSDKDSFIIRKKVFRFEYPVIEVPSTSEAPVKTSIAFPSPAPNVRRRASHRLSLVPIGKQFIPRSPAKPSRRNTLGAAVKSGIGSLPAEPQQQTVEEEAEDVVDMVDGEEGDKVYLESTDAGPATPLVSLLHDLRITLMEKVSGDPFVSNHTEAKSILLSSAASPKARKSISFGTPLPSPLETTTPKRPTGPSRSHSAPSLAMPEVTAQLVRLTPKGSPSLRKSLLLRSARKAWEETRSPGVQGAMDQGKVAIRRKSAGASPKASSPEKSPKTDEKPSSTPVSLREEMSVQQDRKPLQEIQWISEDGKADISMSDSDSDLDSLEADMSLDVPGQSVFSIHPDGPAQGTDESVEEEEPIEDVEDRNYQDDNDENMDISVEEEEPIENDVHTHVLIGPSENQPEVTSEEEEEEEEEVEEVEDDVPDMAFALPGTPAANRAMSQFYTPQARRGLGNSHKPLATIGGPASRFFQSSAASSSTTGSLGKPKRILATVAAAVDAVPATPVQASGTRPPMSERRVRQALATPRTLPPPLMSFKTPIRETPSLNKASHPALNVTLTTTTLGVPSTPIGELRHKLGLLRKQGMASASKLERQGLSSSTSMLLTPATRPTLGTSISLTGVKSRPGPSTFRLTLPRTPVAEAVAGSEVPSLETSPDAMLHTRPMPSGPEDQDADIGNDSGEVEDQEEEEMPRSRSTSPSIPPSLSFTGLRESLRPLAPPKTPNFTGMREMFAPSNSQATPMYSGVKEMLKVPTVAATPNFTGVRDMMRTKAVPPTPAFDGIEEMLAEPELDAFEGEESMEEGFMLPAPQSTKSRGSRGRKASRSTRATRSASADAEASSKPSRSRKPVKADDETTNNVPPSPAKSTRSTKSRSNAKSDTSKSSRGGRGGRKKIEMDTGATLEIIKSSPPRLTLSTGPVEAPSPTKSKPSKSSRAKKEPLMDVDEQVDEVPSKSSRGRKGKQTITEDEPPSTSQASGRKKVTMVEEDKENEDEQEVQIKAGKTKARKARQSTVSSRTRSRA